MKFVHSSSVLALGAAVCVAASGCQFSLLRFPDAPQLRGAGGRVGVGVSPPVVGKAAPVPRSSGPAAMTDAELEHFYNTALGRDTAQFINNQK
jgi:hypothetical protein